jgi:3-hydroxybutyryl-CoA dehydrogenase
MRIAVCANDIQKEELLIQGIKAGTDLIWLKEISEPGEAEVDAIIDLQFENNEKRIQLLQQTASSLVLISSVTGTLQNLPLHFIRFNGWPTFLKRTVWEAAHPATASQSKAEAIFSCFNKKTEWTPDVPGFISARVVVMIINEAYFALEEQVSTKEEIDIAMKLGTNYPFGPFEWSEKIGLKKIYDLLHELSKTNSRYRPAELLKKEALP